MFMNKKTVYILEYRIKIETQEYKEIFSLKITIKKLFKNKEIVYILKS
jgi:hypothetical protein